jgi:hypothetical protein
MRNTAIVSVIIIVFLLSGCTNNITSNHSITVSYVDLNGNRYVSTSEVVSNIGEKVSNNDPSDKNEFYVIPGENPNDELALKVSNGYIKVIRKEIWCNKPDVKNSKELSKAGQCKS